MLDALVASAAPAFATVNELSSFYRGEISELRRVSIGPDLVFGRLMVFNLPLQTASTIEQSSPRRPEGIIDGECQIGTVRLPVPCVRC
jgi:hypothetical protein